MLTPAQQATINQGSINAANAANAKAGIIPTSQANSTTFVNPQNPSTPATSTVDPFLQSFNQSMVNGTKPPLNTSFSTPNQPATVNAPAVYTSKPAQNNLDHITANTNQANTDLQNFNTAQSTNAQNAQQTATQNTQNQPAPTEQPTTTDTGSPLDPAISSILDELGGTTQQDQTNQANDEQTIQADQTANAVDQQTQNNVADSINAMNNGSYPLSSAEQAQVSAIPSQYAGALKLANEALQSATTYGIASNTGLSPQMAMSNIAVTIQKAQQNISKINSTILDAQQKLTTALQASDYKSATALYTQIGNAIKDRQSEISTMNSAINQTQNDIKNTITTQLQAVMDSNTMNYQQKQQALAQATLDEKTKNDLATQALNSLKVKISQASGSGTPIEGLPQVDMTASNTPNPEKQAAFLAQLPPNEASIVKGLANYTINPSSLSTSAKQSMGGLTQSQAVALASQYDPTYDSKQYATRQAMQKNVTSGQYSQVINSANTLIQHLADLQSAIQGIDSPTGGIGDTNFTLGNTIKNWQANIGGNPNITSFNVAKDAVGSEAAKIYKGTGAASEQEIQSWESNLSADSSPAQKQAAVTQIMNLMAGKLATLTQNYQDVMGKSGSFSILTPQSIKTLQSMGLDPSNYDPTYQQNPTVQLQSFHDASPSNAALMDQIMQANPSYQPQDVYNLLQSEGILQ